MKLRSLVFAALAAVMLVVSACAGSPTAPPPPPPPPPPVVVPPPPAPPTWDATKTRIMAFGDSLTEDEGLRTLTFYGLHRDPSGPGGPGSYPFKLHAILTATYTSQAFNVFNLGFGGESAIDSRTKERLVSALQTHTPQVLLLMHGTNDLVAGRSQNTTVDAVEEMVTLAQARGVTVFVASLPPQADVIKGQPNPAWQVPVYNDRLRNMAARRGAFFVDVYSHITPAMLASDGLHLREAGNQRIAEVVYEALKARYHRNPQ